MKKLYFIILILLSSTAYLSYLSFGLIDIGSSYSQQAAELRETNKSNDYKIKNLERDIYNYSWRFDLLKDKAFQQLTPRPTGFYFSTVGHAKNRKGEKQLTVEAQLETGFPYCLPVAGESKEEPISLLVGTSVVLVTRDGQTKQSTISECYVGSDQGPEYFIDHLREKDSPYWYVVGGEFDSVTISDLNKMSRDNEMQETIKEIVNLEMRPKYDNYDYDEAYYFLGTYESEEVVIFNIYCHGPIYDYGYYKTCEKDENIKRAGSYILYKKDNTVINISKGVALRLKHSFIINEGYVLVGGISTGKSSGDTLAYFVKNRSVQKLYYYSHEGS